MEYSVVIVVVVRDIQPNNDFFKEVSCQRQGFQFRILFLRRNLLRIQPSKYPVLKFIPPMARVSVSNLKM